MVMGQLSDAGARAIRELEAARPVDDLVAWLIERMPDADDGEVLAALRAAYARGWRIEPAGTAIVVYRAGSREIRACPQRVLGDA